ncbi:MAG: ribbon-helix-helix domain-containing protein [Propioniciclava sp.]|uniref:ribbon-helix-helix domain-containing protein n=1 Tax=Propioniciclava sp. TaxID=2038686 RepID=UPI0039E29BDB
MKAAISVPDHLFDRVDEVAKKHGMNRSQFYAAAAARYVDELEAADLTAAINAVADLVNADDSNEFAVAAAHRLVVGADDEW